MAGFPDWLWIQNVVFPILGMGMGGFFLFGVYRTVNRAFERRHERAMAQAAGGAAPELAEIRQRLDALDDLALRLGELEERVDFTERMLARGQRGSLPAGGAS